MSGFADTEEAVRREVGVRLFTVLVWDPGRRTLRRVHTSHPDEYPLGGEKTVEVDGDWLSRCVDDQQPYLGADRAAVRSIFADHELIESLGCGAVIDVPVVTDGRTVGVVNALDAEGAYDEGTVDRLVGVLAASDLAIAIQQATTEEAS